MSDDEFQKAVLTELGAIRSEVADGFARSDRRMDALAARMDDVENRIDDLGLQLRLVQSTVSQILDASTRALDGVATLSRRVTSLENPDE